MYFLTFLSILICWYSFGTAIVFPYVYPRFKLEAKSNAGDPLIITPYLEKGLIQEAQNLSRVTITDKIGFPSYAGFFTVNKIYNSNQYFWYFPPFSKNASAPVLLWLQGGPGGSSLFGLFVELGPLVAKMEGFTMRKHHWALDNHLIFIDNPVGTGFSFTDSVNGYCNDESCVAKGLYSSVQQFLTLFPELRKNQFFISGESYAGKYIPALAMEIHKQNGDKTKKWINLQGLAMGNAYCDPVNQIDYGKYLYEHGMIDDAQLKIFEKLQSQIVIEISQNNWGGADILMDRLMDGSLSNISYFKSFTGYDDYYNILQTKSDIDTTALQHLLENDEVRHSVHVGGRPFNSGEAVQIHLAFDILKSVAPYISELLSHYRILFYNGQLDIIVAYPLTENFLRKLDFSSSADYKIAQRKIWRVGNDIAGYVKTAGNLTEVLVRDSGHMVPHDQPLWALDLITCFVRGSL